MAKKKKKSSYQRIKILVVFEGGVLRSVLSSHCDIEDRLRDWDDVKERGLGDEAEAKIGENDSTEYPHELY